MIGTERIIVVDSLMSAIGQNLLNNLTAVQE